MPANLIPIGEIVKGVGETSVGTTLGDAWQALIGDRVAIWRLRNAMATQQLVFEKARKYGLALNTAKIPEKYAFTWFEEATKCDEPEIQIIFARLLAKASTGDSDAMDRRLLSIVGQMTPIDALLFQRIYSDQPFPETGAYSDTEAISKGRVTYDGFRGWPKDWALALLQHFHGDETLKSVEHLVRLGLLFESQFMEGERNISRVPPPDDSARPRGDWRKFIQMHAKLRPFICATALGNSLHQATADNPKPA